MDKKGYIFVLMDGASNWKLLVIDPKNFKIVHSVTTNALEIEKDGWVFNDFGRECEWFDRAIHETPEQFRHDAGVFISVARGGTGCYVDENNQLLDGLMVGLDNPNLVLSYRRHRPEVLELFDKMITNPAGFFRETGSLPGSGLSWGIRGLELQTNPELKEKAVAFCTMASLMAGYLLDGRFKEAAARIGKEHTYMDCHSGLIDIDGQPGALSSFARIPQMADFMNLFPRDFSVVYRGVGQIPEEKREKLDISGECSITPGVHDTTASHIPVQAVYSSSLEMGAGPVIHAEAGSWTLVKQIGGHVEVPEDGLKRGLLAQGSVDGEPGLTSLAGLGFDFKHLKGVVEARHGKGSFGPRTGLNEKLLAKLAGEADCFVLPNIDPTGRGTGPWPTLEGKIINEEKFFGDGETAHIIANLMTAITTARHVDLITQEGKDVPIVLTGGGAQDPYYGRLLATLTGRRVYVMIDKDGEEVLETTALGSAMIAKSAMEGKHPYKVDIGALGITFKEREAFTGKTAAHIRQYSDEFIRQINSAVEGIQRLTPEPLLEGVKRPNGKPKQHA